MRQMDKIGKMMGDVMTESGGLPRELYDKFARENPGDRNATESARAVREAPAIIEKIIKDLESGKISPTISYEDPDQSPVLDVYEAQILREKWSSGMDMPYCMRPYGGFYLSDMIMSAFYGNLDEVNDILGKLSQNSVDRLLKRREGYLQLSAVFMVIIGARQFYRTGMPMGNEKFICPLRHRKIYRQHQEVLERLVELGANLNVHDIAGYTPLHHCLTCSGNEYTVKMAEFLLEKGANVNAVNRFGNPPLIEAIMTQRIEYVKLLIRYKADPLLKNYTEETPIELGMHYPKIHRELRKGERNVVREERNAAKADKKFKVCGKCEQYAEMRCSACFLVWYCGRECQRQHWTEHKPTCIQIRDEYEQVVMVTKIDHVEHFSKSTGKIYPNQCKAKTGHFVVKVQISMDKEVGPENANLLVYNEKRDVQYWIKARSPLAVTLTRAVKEQEHIIGKGFFYSVIRNGKHFIHPRVLPPEKW